MKKRKWFWALLAVFFVALVATLGTSWNIIMFSQYRDSTVLDAVPISGANDLPWFQIILGSLGFITAITLAIIFFWRLFREMKLNQLQSEFLAKVSHELKTPITTLELSSSMLEKENLEPATRNELWRSHRAELDRLKREVISLLRAASWENKPPKPELEPIELESWVKRSLRNWQAILGDKGTLERRGDSLKGTCRLDPRLMELIGNNLIENAKKFAGGTPRMVIETRIVSHMFSRGRQNWEIRFHDFGLGFGSNRAKTLFRRFYRERAYASHAISGSGLGLYFAANASKALGLRLSAESDGPGMGATFVLKGKYHSEG